MAPWNKLDKQVQKTLLSLIILAGGTAATSRCCPMVCDPTPPPQVSPTRSPIICDPPPPPSVRPTRSPVICDPAPPPSAQPPRSPIICDPAPPPSASRTPVIGKQTQTPLPPIICDPQPAPSATRTPLIVGDPTVAPPTAPVPYFQVRNLVVSSDPTSEGGLVRGTVKDQNGNPVPGVRVKISSSSNSVETETLSSGTFALPVMPDTSFLLVVGNDNRSSVSLQLKEHDVATIEFGQITPDNRSMLPLAEIRTIDILWGDDLTFGIETAWPGAKLHWSVTGGTLVEEGESVTWQPPTEPGRYMLEVVADWGQTGLAIDSLVLNVQENGTVII